MMIVISRYQRNPTFRELCTNVIFIYMPNLPVSLIQVFLCNWWHSMGPKCLSKNSGGHPVYVQYDVVITLSMFYKVLTIDSPIPRTMGSLSWVYTLIYVIFQLLQRCMQYHVILDRVITATDCRLMSWFTLFLPQWYKYASACAIYCWLDWALYVLLVMLLRKLHIALQTLTQRTQTL